MYYYTMQELKYSRVLNDTHNTNTDEPRTSSAPKGSCVTSRREYLAKNKDVTDISSTQMFGINSSELRCSEFHRTPFDPTCVTSCPEFFVDSEIIIKNSKSRHEMDKVQENSEEIISTKEVGSIHNDIPNDFYHIMGRSLTMTQSDIIPTSETIPISERVSSNTDEIKDDDVNVLSGDNEVDVNIRPDIRDVRLQCCSCSCVVNYNSK